MQQRTQQSYKVTWRWHREPSLHMKATLEQWPEKMLAEAGLAGLKHLPQEDGKGEERAEPVETF